MCSCKVETETHEPDERIQTMWSQWRKHSSLIWLALIFGFENSRLCMEGVEHEKRSKIAHLKGMNA